MPTKLRKQKKALSAAHLEMLDQAKLNVPEHLVNRIRSASAISESLSKIGRYGWNGYRYCEATGDPIESKSEGKVAAANNSRRQDREDRARSLYLNFRDCWGKRGNAKVIAFEARENLGIDISEGTVARYIKKYPNGL